MTNLQPRTTLVDVAQDLARLDEVLLREIALPHESGVHVLAAPTDDPDVAERLLSDATGESPVR